MSKEPTIIDLTHPIEEGMLTFGAPWHPKVKIKQLGRIEVEGRETREIHLGTHTGTHMDAPLHFLKGIRTIDEISLHKLIGPVTIFDFSHLEENAAVTAEMLKPLKLSKRLIFRFGWGKHWGTSHFYIGWPFFSRDAAEYFVSQDVQLIGMDSPSPDDSRIKLGSPEDSHIHKILLKAEVVLVEYLANLDCVSDLTGWKIIALPLKIKGGDGSPSRVCLYRE